MTKLIFEKNIENTDGIKLTDEKIDFNFINEKYLSITLYVKQ